MDTQVEEEEGQKKTPISDLGRWMREQKRQLVEARAAPLELATGRCLPPRPVRPWFPAPG